ncbi:MAG: ATP-binding protein [Lachnospiraceae bacterium]|nr:ATP-binding protein [Lachnospiraceae bacterium]
MFIGREQELRFLEEKYTEKKGQLIVLYGRRRIGKTETLREFCKNKPHFFYSCTQSTDPIQLARFSAQLLTEDIPAKRYLSVFPDWERAFRALMDLPYGEQKRLVVLDEFPYMCRANASIPSILQNIWDAGWKDSNVMLILCGSAMSFIEKELLAEKNPLYGRATGIYKMKAMSFYDVIKFFPNYSNRDKILTYAILGGVPHYLKQWDPNLSVAENIKRNILTKGCVLYSEVEFLLHQELRETPIYNSIIEAVALGSTRLNEISQKSMIDDTAKTSVYLRNLVELGIVEREFSVDSQIKEKANTKRGIYRLTDHFFRFWYRFGFTNLSLLEDGDAEGVFRYSIEPELSDFAALPFEDVCREFVKKLQKKNEMPFRYARMGRWWGRTTVRCDERRHGLSTQNPYEMDKANDVTIAESEIDLLAFDQDGKKYLVGECKFKNSVFRYSEYLDTKAKLAPLKKNADFYYVLFSASGFDEKIIEEADGERLRVFSLDDIVGCG